MEIDKIKKLVRKYPNDMELGEAVRQYINTLEDVKYIYESPDGGETIYRRRFNEYGDKELITNNIQRNDDLTAWENEYGSVSRKQAKARLKYLNSELAHEDYHDGWTAKGMKEEKEWLENQLEIQKRK